MMEWKRKEVIERSLEGIESALEGK